MNNQIGIAYNSLQDSITAKQDSLSAPDSSGYSVKEDTLSVPKSFNSLPDSDSLHTQTDIPNAKDTIIPIHIKSEIKSVIRSTPHEEKVEPDTVKGPAEAKPAISRYSFTDTTEHKFGYKPGENFLRVKNVSEKQAHPLMLKEYQSQKLQLNWTLSIGIVCILLLLSLKRFYQKFISQVAATMVNYQLAEKMLREKNIIVRRAFFLLNLNFIFVLSLFILNLTIFWKFSLSENYVYDYFIILGIVVSIIFARIVLLYISGFIFGTKQAFTEHIHISFLVNKNLGLIMLPVVFIIIYTTTKVSEIAIYLCLGLLVIATFYKIIRGFQIIIRNGVLIFYAFLYLCTLELLPLVLGSKLIISLR